MPAQFTIRRFAEGDQAEVKDLICRIMADEFKEDQGAYPTGDIERVQDSYGKIGDAFFVALDGNRIIGTVAIKKEDERVALLRRLFVASEYRKKHIGVKLVERAMQFCQEVGYEELIFKTTSRMQGAIQLCQKKGFIQRAQIHLGSFELLRFTLSLKNGQNQPVSTL